MGFLFHLIEISFTLFLVEGLWFSRPTRSYPAADVASHSVLRKTRVFSPLYVDPYFHASVSKTECSRDKSTSNDGVGRRRLVASPEESVGGEFCPLQRPYST